MCVCVGHESFYLQHCIDHVRVATSPTMCVHVYVFVCMRVSVSPLTICRYGVAADSRIDKIIGLFYKRAL